MAVSDVAYRIIKRAVALRLDSGEFFYPIMESYPKMSAEQVQQLREEMDEKGLIVHDAEEAMGLTEPQ